MRSGWPSLLLLCLSASVSLAAEPATSPSTLRSSAAASLADLRRSLTDTGRPFQQLQTELIELAVRLEHAGLDSLAAEARRGAANALIRLTRRAEAEQQLHLAVAAALRARDVPSELRARLQIIDGRINTDPGIALKAVRETMPRIRSLRSDALLADAYSTEGHAHDAMGDFKKALVAYQKAASHSARDGDTHQCLMALTQSSQALRFLGRHPEALVLTDSVITLARREGLDAPLGRALFERASMLRTTRQNEPALAAIDEAIRIQKRRGDRGRLQTARLLRGATYLQMARFEAAAAEAETLLATASVQSTPVTLARAISMRARGLIGLGRAYEADTLLAGNVERIERYRAALPTDQDRAAAGEHLSSLYEAWTRARLARGRPGEAWVAAERGRAIALEQRMGAGQVPELRALQARLRETSAALILFDSVDPGLGNVLIVSADTVAGYPVRPPGILADDLSAITDRAAAARALGPATEASVRVSRTLFQDAWPHLSQRVRRLVIVPPSRLESLPFEILPSPVAGESMRLGDRFDVTYVPSASVFVTLDGRDVPGRGLTVVADPEVDANREPIAKLDPALRGAVSRPLPGARAEARRLGRAGATPLVGREATLERLLAAPPAAVLHFASHAFEGREGVEGGLVLAGREPLLSPSRIESVGLRADLVTLAGCGTLGTTQYSGEGTFGLARAFLVSGARTVLATRWDVSDRAAAAFMDTFYAALAAGEPRDRSLSLARARLEAAGFAPRDCWAFALMGIGDRPIPPWANRRPGKSATLGK